MTDLNEAISRLSRAPFTLPKVFITVSQRERILELQPDLRSWLDANTNTYEPWEPEPPRGVA